MPLCVGKYGGCRLACWAAAWGAWSRLCVAFPKSESFAAPLLRRAVACWAWQADLDFSLRDSTTRQIRPPDSIWLESSLCTLSSFHHFARAISHPERSMRRLPLFCRLLAVASDCRESPLRLFLALIPKMRQTRSQACPAVSSRWNTADRCSTTLSSQQLRNPSCCQTPQRLSQF